MEGIGADVYGVQFGRGWSGRPVLPASFRVIMVFACPAVIMPATRIESAEVGGGRVSQDDEYQKNDK
jgi:hypothetical protein